MKDNQLNNYNIHELTSLKPIMSLHLINDKISGLTQIYEWKTSREK